MDKNAQLATLNNAINAMDELDIKGSSSGLHNEIKLAIKAVMQALVSEVQAAQQQETAPSSSDVTL
jgi:hypothetical protein